MLRKISHRTITQTAKMAIDSLAEIQYDVVKWNNPLITTNYWLITAKVQSVRAGGEPMGHCSEIAPKLLFKNIAKCCSYKFLCVKTRYASKWAWRTLTWHLVNVEYYLTSKRSSVQCCTGGSRPMKSLNGYPGASWVNYSASDGRV